MAFVWFRWTLDHVATDGRGVGQKKKDTNSKVCLNVLSCQQEELDLWPLLTSNLGCQHHFLEWPVKLNMWTETRRSLDLLLDEQVDPAGILALLLPVMEMWGYVRSKTCFYQSCEGNRTLRGGWFLCIRSKK